MITGSNLPDLSTRYSQAFKSIGNLSIGRERKGRVRRNWSWRKEERDGGVTGRREGGSGGREEGRKNGREDEREGERTGEREGKK